MDDTDKDIPDLIDIPEEVLFLDYVITTLG